MRAFLAIELDDYVKNKIISTQDEIFNLNLGNIKFVEEENMHLTVKFFGDINKTMQCKISETVRNTLANYDPYTMKVVGIGAFPNTRRPRVIWTTVKDQNKTENMIKQLDQGFNKLGLWNEAINHT